MGLVNGYLPTKQARLKRYFALIELLSTKLLVANVFVFIVVVAIIIVVIFVVSLLLVPF